MDSKSAYFHLATCDGCCSVARRYGREILSIDAIPEQLATKIRAQLCPMGRQLFDGLVGVRKGVIPCPR